MFEKTNQVSVIWCIFIQKKSENRVGKNNKNIREEKYTF